MVDQGGAWTKGVGQGVDQGGAWTSSVFAILTSGGALIQLTDLHPKQVERFNSCYVDRGSRSFTVDWHGKNNWWCLPPGLIPQVIRHAEK